MKILRVEIDQDEQEHILKELIQRFDCHSDEKQTLNFPLNETVEIWAELELETEGYVEEDTNGVVDTGTTVRRFSIKYTVDGAEVDIQLSGIRFKSKIDGFYYTKRATDIEDLIINNYTI